MTTQHINGRTYSIDSDGGAWYVYLDGIDIAEFPTKHLAEAWVRDRARKVELSAKTVDLIESL